MIVDNTTTKTLDRVDTNDVLCLTVANYAPWMHVSLGQQLLIFKHLTF